MSDELQQGFQLPSKTQQIPAFRPNFASSPLSNAAIANDKDVFQQPKEPVMSQQWIFNIPKIDKDYLTYRPPKLPPGLPVPNTSSVHQSQMQKKRHETTTVNEKRGNKSYLDSFLDLSNVFNPQSEAITPYFHSRSEDNIYNGAKPISSEQCDSQDPSQLLNGFQSFMVSEHDVSFHGNFADVYRETQSRHDEERMAEHWKFTSPSMPTHITPAAQTTKERAGVQMERNGVMRNEMVHREGIQNLHGFSSPNTELFQQPKMFPGSVSLANHYQTKMTMQKHSNLLPFNLKNNQCLNQQEHIQGNIKSQMQKEKRRMSGIHGENLHTSHITNCSTKGREKSHQMLDHFEIMQSQRFAGENGRGGAADAQQSTSRLYPVNDPTRHWSMNSSNYHSRSPLSYGNPDPTVSVRNMMSAHEFTTAQAVGKDLMTQRGDPTCHGHNSAMEDVSVVQLYHYLDDCCHQLRCLETERKQVCFSIEFCFRDLKHLTVINAIYVDIVLKCFTQQVFWISSCSSVPDRDHSNQGKSRRKDHSPNQHYSTQNATKSHKNWPPHSESDKRTSKGKDVVPHCHLQTNLLQQYLSDLFFLQLTLERFVILFRGKKKKKKEEFQCRPDPCWKRKWSM